MTSQRLGRITEGPFLNHNRNFQIVNNTSWIRGNHTFKFGIDISEARYAQIGNQFARGEFNVEQHADRRPEQHGARPATAFASFMTGWLNEATRAAVCRTFSSAASR